MSSSPHQHQQPRGSHVPPQRSSSRSSQHRVVSSAPGVPALRTEAAWQRETLKGSPLCQAPLLVPLPYFWPLTGQARAVPHPDPPAHHGQAVTLLLRKLSWLPIPKEKRPSCSVGHFPGLSHSSPSLLSFSAPLLSEHPELQHTASAPPFLLCACSCPNGMLSPAHF